MALSNPQDGALALGVCLLTPPPQSPRSLQSRRSPPTPSPAVPTGSPAPPHPAPSPSQHQRTRPPAAAALRSAPAPPYNSSLTRNAFTLPANSADRSANAFSVDSVSSAASTLGAAAIPFSFACARIFFIRLNAADTAAKSSEPRTAVTASARATASRTSSLPPPALPSPRRKPAPSPRADRTPAAPQRTRSSCRRRTRRPSKSR